MAAPSSIFVRARRGALVVVLASIAMTCALVSACTRQSSCGERLVASFMMRMVGTGSATWSVGGASPQSVALQTTGVCSTTGPRGDFAASEFGDTTPPTTLSAGWDFGCGDNRGPSLSAFLDLGDPRDWSVGTVTLTGKAANFSLRGLPTTCSGNGATCPSCTATADDLAIIITVEKATGGSSPYPQMVTKDFQRTFRVQLDTAKAHVVNSPVDCQTPLMRVDVKYDVMASDFTYDPHQRDSCN